NQAIAALGEARSNTAVFQELAQRMGFKDECFKESVDQMIDAALNSNSPQSAWLGGITRERLEAEGAIHLEFGQKDFLPFANGNFFTPSGKAELYSAALAARGMDPVAEFIPPQESRHTEKAKQFPLELLSRKADNFLNSSFCNVESVQKMEQP